MRRRLYQALPEQIEMIDNVHSARKEKTKKRLYAEYLVKGHDTEVEGVTECFESLDEIFTLAANQLDALYSLYGTYGKECAKIPSAIHCCWNHAASTSVKFVDWYMHVGKAAWKTGFAVACNPFSRHR